MERATPWPNGLGFDVGPHEVWAARTDGAWGVRTSNDGGQTFDRCLLVPASERAGRLFPFTPEDAVAACLTRGEPTD